MSRPLHRDENVEQFQKRCDGKADSEPCQKGTPDSCPGIPELPRQYGGQQTHARVQNRVQIRIVCAFDVDQCTTRQRKRDEHYRRTLGQDQPDRRIIHRSSLGEISVCATVSLSAATAFQASAITPPVGMVLPNLARAGWCSASPCALGLIATLSWVPALGSDAEDSTMRCRRGVSLRRIGL